jgi:hypothetical protein
MSKTCAGSFFLLLLGCRHAAPAQELVVKTDDAAANAFRQYHMVTEQVIGLLASGEAKPHLCPIEKDNYKCFSIGDRTLLLPPYPLGIDLSFSGFAWAPARQVKGGQEYYERLDKESRSPNACTSDQCQSVMPASDDTHTVKLLVRCSGPLNPTVTSNCKPVVLLTSDGPWIPAVVGYSTRQGPLAPAGQVDFTISIVCVYGPHTGNAAANSRAKDEALLKATVSLLQALPFGLQVTASPPSSSPFRTTVTGYAEQRHATVLKSGYEWMTVRADISEEPQNDRSRITVAVSSTVLTNMRPTRVETEWHPVDRQQNEVFKSALYQ